MYFVAYFFEHVVLNTTNQIFEMSKNITRFIAYLYVPIVDHKKGWARKLWLLGQVPIYSGSLRQKCKWCFIIWNKMKYEINFNGVCLSFNLISIFKYTIKVALKNKKITFNFFCISVITKTYGKKVIKGFCKIFVFLTSIKNTVLGF